METGCQVQRPAEHPQHEPTCPRDMDDPISPSSTKMLLPSLIHHISPCTHSYLPCGALVDVFLIFLCDQVSPSQTQGMRPRTNSLLAVQCHSTHQSQHGACPCQDAGHWSCSLTHALPQCAHAIQGDTSNPCPGCSQRHLQQCLWSLYLYPSTPWPWHLH